MHRLLRIIYILILILTPLLFGTVERWSLTLMLCSCFFAISLLLIALYLQKIPIYQTPAIVPLLCLLGYILIQILPLPAFLIEWISPTTFALYQDTLGSITTPDWIPLSIHPRKTISEFFRFSAYVAFYILTIQLLSKRRFVKLTVRIITIFATLLAIEAMVQHYTSSLGAGQKIYWFRELSQGGAPFGPYVNRNHYAGWMGMVFPVIFGMFLLYTPRGYRRSFREKWVDLITDERTNIYILLGLAAFLTSFSIIMTLSRGGILSLCLASFFFATMIIVVKPVHRKGILIITCIAIMVLFLGWMGWEPVFNRFDSTLTAEGTISGQRMTIWNDSFNIAKDFPVAGSGFGTYQDIYPKYSHFSGNLIMQHAHNDYLELLTDGGIIGALFVTWAFLVFIYKSTKAFRKRKDPFAIYLYIGSLAGIISIFVHSLIDFNLHVGANGLYLFFLMGINVSAANTRISYRKKDTNLKVVQIPYVGASVSLGIILMLTFIIFNISGLIGEIYYTSIKGVRLGKHLSDKILHRVVNRAQLATYFDPLEAKYRYALANIEAYKGNDTEAFIQYQSALGLNPSRGEYMQRLALKLSVKKQHEAAEKLYRAAIQYYPNDSEKQYQYAAWLFSQSRKTDALFHLKQAIALEPRKVADSLTMMVVNGISEADIQKALPDRVEPHLLFADFLWQTGKSKRAETFYRRALDYVQNEPAVHHHFFFKVADFYLLTNRLDDAIDVINKAIELLPSDGKVYLKKARILEKSGNFDQAVMAYRQALSIDPKNTLAKRRIKKILKQ